MSLPGWATEEGTASYRRRFEGKLPHGHFRRLGDLQLSSIGLGTYLGNPDPATDELYHRAVVRAVELGCNVIDSAINYRFQRSERAIGTALKELAERGIAREEIVIATKGGFIPFDGAPPGDIRGYFETIFVKPGIAAFSDVVAGSHCMTPSYLLHQLDQSLKNLAVDCLDIYYVHNPETQLGKIPRDEFNRRLLAAFQALEGAAQAGKIRVYGAATWNGYRNEPQAKDYLSLAEMVEIAKKAGGEEHRFKVIQLPLNLGMAEAVAKKNQQVDGEALSILEAAERLGVGVMCSASILQGQLARELPPIIAEVFANLDTNAQRSLQFVRSTPGVTTALVGMKQLRHVEENLKVAELPPTPWEEYEKLFKAS